MLLTQREAKRAILDEWRVWPKEHDGHTAHDMLKFVFTWLRKHKPGLLQFTCSGDYWQVVKGWLEEYEGFNRRERVSY